MHQSPVDQRDGSLKQYPVVRVIDEEQMPSQGALSNPADQALAHEALKADVVGKTNTLVRMQFDEQQASVRAVVSCKSSSDQAVIK